MVRWVLTRMRFSFEIYDFTITDPDNDIVDMTLNILPGENYVKSTEIPEMISAPQNFNGSIDVHVEVVDVQGSADIHIVPLSVYPVNDVSFLVTSALDIINNGPAIEEQSYSLTLSWEDPDGSGDANAYEVLLGGPAENWLEVANVYSSGSGANIIYSANILGVPDDVNLVQNDLSFTVVDRSEGLDESFTEYYYIPINQVNDAPKIEVYAGPTDFPEDEQLVLSISNFIISDPDNSPIDMSLTLRPGNNYDIGSDLKTVIPYQNYNGALNVKALISDGEKVDSVLIDFNVIPVNDPIIVANVGDVQATEEIPFNMSLTWTDIDGSGTDGYEVYLTGSATNWISLGAVIEDQGVFSVLISGTPDDENFIKMIFL